MFNFESSFHFGAGLNLIEKSLFKFSDVDSRRAKDKRERDFSSSGFRLARSFTQKFQSNVRGPRVELLLVGATTRLIGFGMVVVSWNGKKKSRRKKSCP